MKFFLRFTAACILAAHFVFLAGRATGRAVHWLSDRLAGLASGRIDRAATARAVVAWARDTLDAVEPAPAAAEPLPSIADTMRAACAAMAASDARIYRAAGDSIARMRATLDAAKTVTVAACAPVAAPKVAVAHPPVDSLTVRELRKMARARGLSSLARKGRRADLLAALTD
jgi:hypothetical protein